MNLRFTCPNCGHAFNVPENFAGRRGKCKQCGVQIQVPDSTVISNSPPLPRQSVASVPSRSSNDSGNIRNPWWAIGLVGTLVVVLLGGLTYRIFRPSATASLAKSDPLAIDKPTATPSAPPEEPEEKPTDYDALTAGAPPLLRAVPEKYREEIAGYEAKLAENRGKLDYGMIQDLRDRYMKIDEKRRAAYVCELIFSHKPNDAYTLNCLGAWPFNGAKAPGFLLEWPERFPEFRRVGAACRLRAAELVDDPAKAKELIRLVETTEGAGLEHYHILAKKAVEKINKPEPPVPEGVLTLLAELRKAGKAKIADELATRIEQDKKNVRQYARETGHTIVGRVVVEGPIDPTQVGAQMRILEEGYFADGVRESGKPVGFRLEGYEPVDVIPQGEIGSVEYVGTVRLAKLAKANEARIRGKVELEGQTDASGARVTADIEVGPINNTFGGYEGLRGIIQDNGRYTGVDGVFHFDGLTPSDRSIFVHASGYYSTYVSKVTTKPGKETDVGTVQLKLAHEFAVSFLESRKSPFAGEPKRVRHPAETYFDVVDLGNAVRLSLSFSKIRGRVLIHSFHGPFQVADAGLGKLEDFRDINPTQHKFKSDVEPKEGHLYLGKWTWPEERYVLFAVEEMKQLSASQAAKLLEKNRSKPGETIRGQAPRAEADLQENTIWPNAISRANSDPWLATNHDKIRQMRPRLLVINFTNGLSRKDAESKIDELIQSLDEATRFHGYADPQKRPGFLQYQLSQYVDLQDEKVLPSEERLDGNSSRYPRVPNSRSGINFRYDALFSDEFTQFYKVTDPAQPTRFLTLAEMVEQGVIHEVWFLAKQGDFGAPFECTEVKQAYTASFKKIPGRWVQAGNGGTDKQPFIGRSLRILFVNSERGPGCAMESLGHALEGTSNSGAIPYFTKYFVEYAGFDLDKRYRVPFNSFYAVDYGTSSMEYPKPNVLVVVHKGKPLRVDPYVAVGGNAHFTPNGRSHYDLDNKAPVLSTIEHFRQGDGPNGKDKAEVWTTAKLDSYRKSCPDCMGPWLVYWRQNMPGLDNKAKDDTRKPMKNWWPFLFY